MKAIRVLSAFQFFILATLLVVFGIMSSATAQETKKPDAKKIVEGAVNYMRGDYSEAVADMTIHRPDWERKMTIKAYTKGMTDSVFWIMAPPKDRGNGTLKKGKEMWIYNPKVNQVIKLPPSMMSQSWQGSDFSNNDLAKSDTIVDDYTHQIVGTEKKDGMTVYIIRSIPKPEAAVVWGMLKIYIRQDKILLREEFYDEDRKLVKAMTIEKIGLMGGKLYPLQWKMAKAGAVDEYTLIDYESLNFDVHLPDHLFTISSLREPRW